MSGDGLIDYGLQLGEAAARRFVHWDSSLWDALLTGPLHTLAEGLAGSRLSHQQALSIGRAYLELACEAVGAGYLYPPAAGRQNLFSLLWRELIPRDLPSAPADRQAELLAMCWNLGENVESSPPWLQRILLHACASLARLDDLEPALEAVSRRVLDTPAKPLGASPRALWVYLPVQDPRFLPGWAHFVSPTVLCVHDRARSSAENGHDVTCGVLVDDSPMVLGPLSCDLRSASQSPAPAPLPRFAVSDPRVTPAFHVAANEWRAAASLVTSQYLLLLCP